MSASQASSVSQRRTSLRQPASSSPKPFVQGSWRLHDLRGLTVLELLKGYLEFSDLLGLCLKHASDLVDVESLVGSLFHLEPLLPI